ncbi:hypothetical protein SPI_06535 [Niveomyces insectorum RCEF 264]|uniref:DUF8021 domain-containing protein n=1 Tax=Niveomyces insectorum RCEF 264 TaxID=1081102 RepID=A0A167RCH7_9HYPO|nr:hypothetical protein SPI_06535 [Niveomyces insectorum RCEF 264]
MVASFLLLAGLTGTAALAAAATANCTREFLANATEAYVQAQTHGTPDAFAALFAPNATYAENDKTTAVHQGILTVAMRIDRTHRYYDTTQCGAFAEVIVASPNATASHTPYLIHTRFLYGRGPAVGVTTVESVVTKPGDWAFNATGYLHYDGMEQWPAIPAAARDTRAVVQAAGDAYFDRFDNASVVIPMASACARLEGGSYTARGNYSANTCEGYPSTIKVTNRRYIVDEVYGVVDIFEGFPMLDRSVPSVAVPDSHLFRVEHGKIRYIHTVSHCINYNCGLNKTTFGRRNLAAVAGPVQLST